MRHKFPAIGKCYLCLSFLQLQLHSFQPSDNIPGSFSAEICFL